MPYNPQDYADKKKRQLARAKEIKEARAAVATSAGAAPRHGGSGSSEVVSTFSPVDLAQHVSRAGPIAEARGVILMYIYFCFPFLFSLKA